MRAFLWFPTEKKGTVGAGAIGVVKEGKFTIPARYGVLPGHYTITIISEEKVPLGPNDDPSMSKTVSKFPPYVFEHEFTTKDQSRHMTIEIPSKK